MDPTPTSRFRILSCFLIGLFYKKQVKNTFFLRILLRSFSSLFPLATRVLCLMPVAKQGERREA
jgi:hypothetical protein